MKGAASRARSPCGPHSLASPSHHGCHHRNSNVVPHEVPRVSWAPAVLGDELVMFLSFALYL